MKKYPYLIILKGKHGNHYFHVGQDGDREKALSSIFQINSDNGYYPRVTDQPYYESEIGTQSAIIDELRKAADTLSEGVAKSEINRQLRRALQLKQSYEDALGEILFIKNLSPDDIQGKAKFALEREGHEYEEIEFETYSK